MYIFRSEFVLAIFIFHLLFIILALYARKLDNKVLDYIFLILATTLALIISLFRPGFGVDEPSYLEAFINFKNNADTFPFDYSFKILYEILSNTGIQIEYFNNTVSSLYIILLSITAIVTSSKNNKCFSFPAAQNRFQYYIFWIMEKIGSICGDKLICLHKDDAVIAQEKLFIHKNKISIIENGVDTNKFKKRNNNEIDKLSTYFNIDRNSDVVVGMIGRLWPQKNPMLLLYAAKNIINNNKRVKFLFVGDGELKDSMNDYIIQNKLTQNITICGWCNDVSSYLNIFDIFVLPSLWEGMPLAILEAESSSLPCIVSNIPGNRSIIRHTVDGYLFSLDNPSELESYINILIEDKERRIILGNNARVKILESYKIENRILKLDELYSSISLKE